MMYDSSSEQHEFDGEEGATYSTPPAEAPLNPFIRMMAPHEVETVNNIIRLSEGITAQMLTVWEKRNKLRQVIADMVCPWRVGMVIVLGDGKGPMDRRVVTAVLPGKTETGEFYRVKTRVLKKGSALGKKEVSLRVVEGLEVSVLGMFTGGMEDREDTEEVKEV